MLQTLLGVIPGVQDQESAPSTVGCDSQIKNINNGGNGRVVGVWEAVFWGVGPCRLGQADMGQNPGWSGVGGAKHGLQSSLGSTSQSCLIFAKNPAAEPADGC